MSKFTTLPFAGLAQSGLRTEPIEGLISLIQRHIREPALRTLIFLGFGAVLGWQAGVVVFFAAPFFAILTSVWKSSHDL